MVNNNDDPVRGYQGNEEICDSKDPQQASQESQRICNENIAHDLLMEQKVQFFAPPNNAKDPIAIPRAIGKQGPRMPLTDLYSNDSSNNNRILEDHMNHMHHPLENSTTAVQSSQL